LAPPWGQNLCLNDNEIQTFLPHPIGSREAGKLKFAIYVPHVQKMHHIKFEKNWSSGYQEEVKFSNDNTQYISCLAPPWGQNLYPEDNEINNFGRGLPALHYHAFSFS
jgi:hypothetical protein